MSDQQIAIFAFCIIAILVWYGLILMHHFRQENEFKKKTLELGELDYLSRSRIDLEIPMQLEAMINEVFDDYKALRLLPENNLYITEEREEQIRKELSSMVAARISPHALKKFSMYYNEKMLIEKVISEKIYLVVTNFVWQTNAGADGAPPQQQ